MLVSNDWKDYECIDAGNGEKLERWGNVILRRPDPWALWTHKDSNIWNNYHAVYHRSDKGGGYWENVRKFPEFWTINYKDLKFKVSPTGFKFICLYRRCNNGGILCRSSRSSTCRCFTWNE